MWVCVWERIFSHFAIHIIFHITRVMLQRFKKSYYWLFRTEITLTHLSKQFGRTYGHHISYKNIRIFRLAVMESVWLWVKLFHRRIKFLLNVFLLISPSHYIFLKFLFLSQHTNLNGSTTWNFSSWYCISPERWTHVNKHYNQSDY